MTTKTKKLTPPAPLDIYSLHSPHEQDMHRAEVDAFREAVRAEEARQQLKEQAAAANANRVLDRDQYFELAKQRQAEQQAREAEREAKRKAEEEAEAAYLASLPDVAEVMESSEFNFLTTLGHWFAKGYTLPDDGIQHFVRGCYAVRLHKPTATAKKSK